MLEDSSHWNASKKVNRVSFIYYWRQDGNKQSLRIWRSVLFNVRKSWGTTSSSLLATPATTVFIRTENQFINSAKEINATLHWWWQNLLHGISWIILCNTLLLEILFLYYLVTNPSRMHQIPYRFRENYWSMDISTLFFQHAAFFLTVVCYSRNNFSVSFSYVKIRNIRNWDQLSGKKPPSCWPS